MAHPTKITTCCYCGTRAALVLAEPGAHLLSCSACGAPIREIKQMPVRAPGKKEKSARDKQSTPGKARKKAVSHLKPPKKPKKAKGKKRASPLRWFLEEAKDAIEDIFD